jgi:hypothetical protein
MWDGHSCQSLLTMLPELGTSGTTPDDVLAKIEG